MGKRGEAAHVLIGQTPRCWGQCWVHQHVSAKGSDPCGDKPKSKREPAPAKGGEP